MAGCCPCLFGRKTKVEELPTKGLQEESAPTTGPKQTPLSVVNPSLQKNALTPALHPKSSEKAVSTSEAISIIKDAPIPENQANEHPGTANRPETDVVQFTEKQASSIPVRMLIVKTCLELLAMPGGIPCFEDTPAFAYDEIDFDDFMENVWKDCAVISWRWAKPKPRTHEEAQDPSKNPVPPDMMRYVLELAKRDKIRYVWLDWSCAPQYPADLDATMREINRSGHYYARARGFYVWCFAGPVTRSSFTYNDYVFRAWTLAERLHRTRDPATALVTSDFLPAVALDGMFDASTQLERADGLFKTWGRSMAEINLEIVKCLGGPLTPAALNFITGKVMSRYPVLEAMLRGLDGPLRSVLKPAARAAMVMCLQLRALAEWVMRPEEGLDDMTRASGLDPEDFKMRYGVSLANVGKQIINNLERTPIHNLVEDVYIACLNLSTIDAAVAALPPLAALWSAAASTRTAEEPGQAWLRRYLVWDAGRAYQAHSRPDLFFAVYKVFGLADHRYGEEKALYHELVEAAGLRHLRARGPYAWLREVVAVGPEDCGGLSCQIVGARNCRKVEAPAACLENFGGLGFEHVGEGSGGWSGLGAQEVREVLTPKENGVRGVLVGLRLGAGAQRALGAGWKLRRVVDTAAEEIDENMSLRGRRAFAEVEGLVEESVRASMGGEVWECGCALWVAVRMHLASDLLKVVVMRTSEDPSTRQWTPEVLSAFGSGAVKGGAGCWGMARCLENLVGDVESAGGGGGVETVVVVTAPADEDPSEGASAASKGYVPRVKCAEPMPAWFKSRMAIVAGPAPAVVQQEDLPPQDPVAGGQQCGVEEEEDPDFEEALGKTGFSDEDLERVRRAYRAMVRRGFDGVSMTYYFKVMSSNYVHDSIMAQHLDYFTSLCNMYADHLTSPGASELTEQSAIMEKLRYMAEDLGDAIGDSDQDDLKDDARAAVARLEAAMEAAADD